uniref:Sushi domain-containing protein n=2 Tax=Hucho hucho TaxID=62062 RepID=A0A4W5K7S6_9TELE
MRQDVELCQRGWHVPATNGTVKPQRTVEYPGEKMSDGMVLCETRALASSSSPVHRLATSALLFLLLALLPHGHASGCPQPPAVQHGELVNQTEANRGSFPPGTLLSYGCEPGYTPDGPTTITCTTAGTWSHQPPRCIHADG